MKDHWGKILLGSAVVVAGVSLFLYFDETAREKVEGVLNRERAKMFVKHRLNGSDAMVSAVDSLSDTEINTLMKVMNSTSKAKDKASDTFSDIMDKAKEVTSDVTHKVTDMF
ncbi:hypothetical protein [Fundicoccus culcitae]|uniref:Uncharacterized protein n=1 Tax=Fundicoccus culcitae TaxID=2969821 RepID=A0ABY5P3Y7_9LACT|nr:hypothetical protein [Fundicoccus culcitae]UUX33120.1 hypothetical protein NRE15_09410 [Fundicoccus culcitae]